MLKFGTEDCLSQSRDEITCFRCSRADCEELITKMEHLHG